MKDKCFLDTNLLIYMYDLNEVIKRDSIVSFVNTIKNKVDLIISVQTLGEFFNVVTKKLKYEKKHAIKFCQELREMFPVYEISTENVFHAMNISKQTQFSYWDSLILAMAIDTGCSVLYSEDLSSGQEIEGLKVVNPFLS